MTLFNSSLETDSFLATCLARITTGQQKYLKILVPSLQFRFLLRQLCGIFHSYFKIQTVVLSLPRNSAFICGKKERTLHSRQPALHVTNLPFRPPASLPLLQTTSPQAHPEKERFCHIQVINEVFESRARKSDTRRFFQTFVLITKEPQSCQQ